MLITKTFFSNSSLKGIQTPDHSNMNLLGCFNLEINNLTNLQFVKIFVVKSIYFKHNVVNKLTNGKK